MRLEAIRRSLASTSDPAGRGRLRVRLADALTAAGDLAAAVTELKQAAAEAPATVGLVFGARSLVARMPPEAGQDLLAALGRVDVPPSDAPSPSRRGRLRQARPTASAGASRAGSSLSGVPAARLAAAAASGPLGLGAGPRVSSLPLAAIPAPAPLAPSGPHVVSRGDPLERAFAALADGKPVRARKLAEEVARGRSVVPGGPDRLRDLVDQLDRAGARRQSLLLARTLVEAGDPARTGEVAATLSALVARARESGDVDLALRWGSDLVRPLARPPGTDSPVWRGADDLQRQFREAQAAVVNAADADDVRAALDQLTPLLSGDVLGRAALALALRVAERLGPQAPARRLELLRSAFEQDSTAEGREILGRRWMEALGAEPDPSTSAAALGVLDRAIAGAPADETTVLRGLRAALLRRLERDAELARALESDAEMAIGPDLVDLLTEQADRLERVGQADRALEVRLAALVDAPGDLTLLGPARRRLESLGQVERSLDLVVAALPHITERAARLSHLRDVASLAETAADDRARAVSAWLEVLALDPDDAAAFAAAERLLRELDDQARLAELLAWAATRLGDPEARLAVLWRLAECRRAEGRSAAALAHYREIIEARGRGKEADPLGLGDGWRRRDDRLSVESARVLAAPHAAARATALTDRGLALVEAARLEEAERDLSRAFELGPEAPEILPALERLHERRGDWRGLRQRLQTRVSGATGEVAARLWCGIGRANERLGDGAAAEAAYAQARSADPTSRAPLEALRRLATARRDWAEASRLLDKEIERARHSPERVALLIEHAGLLADKLERHDQAVEALEAALAFQPNNVDALEAMYGSALRSGAWEKAAQAMEGLVISGGPMSDVAERYHRIGRAAESAGSVDRALGFYSRAYARNPAFRPTLERLSEICFERQQWDNAWKATAHLIDRHGADMEPGARAELALRAALADLHVAQRMVALPRAAEMPGMPAGGAGLRDVADAWASMRFDPRLLAAIDDDKRGRARARLKEVLALTERTPGHPARQVARETWTALAMVDRRWAEAVEALESFAGDGALEPRRRCLFLVAAGDILLHQQGDVGGAALRYERARALYPSEPRLARRGVVQVAQSLTESSSKDVTEDKVRPRS